MKINKINFKNSQVPVQILGQNANPQTAPTQTEPSDATAKITSAASSNPIAEKPSLIKATEALKSQIFAQAPISYTFVKEIKLPFSNNAKLYKLANGQQVAILEKKGSTVLKSFYNVGSLNEKDNERGISHFNEHMAFNGSKGPLGKTLNAGEFFKTINEMGASTNASTSFAMTDYFISSQLLSKNSFEKSAFLQSQQLQYPEHTEEMVTKEKGPVTQEISMVGDQPLNIAINNCIKNLFQIKSNSTDLIAGTISNINNLTRKNTLDYHNLWYTPDNCVTVVTGEIPEKEAIQTIARHFNKFSDADISQRKYQEFNPITKSIRVDVKSPKAHSTSVSLGFVGPANNSTKETIILETLMTTLLGHKNSRIQKSLNKIQSNASMNIEKVGNRPSDPKAIVIHSQMSPEKSEEVIQKIYNEIANIAQNPISKDELETSKKILKMTFSKISENSLLLNSLIGNTISNGNLDYIENYLDIINSITPDDINKFAQKYLDLNKVSLSVIHPENISDENIINNHKKINNSSANSKKIAFKGKPENNILNLSKIKQYKLANNMEVTFNKNNSDITSSIITLKTPAPADIKPAVPLLFSTILNKGSKTKDYETLYKDIHNAGININFEANSQSITITAENLSEDNAKVFNLIKEVIKEPRFNNETFEEAKKIVIESIKNIDNYADENAFKALFPNAPEFATKEEVLKSINETTLADVMGFHEYIKRYATATATITAPTDKNPNIENDINQNLSNNFINFQPFQNNVFDNYQKLEKDVVIKKIEPKNQADIVKAFKFKTNHNPKDQLTFKLLNTILGESSSSRLFSDLRESQKLAYHVNSELNYFGNTGVISLGIQTTTDDKTANVQSFENVNKSLAGFDKHIEKLKNELVTENELKSAKLKIKTRMMNSFESSMSQTNVLDYSKHSIQGINQVNENMKLIDTITAQDIQNAAKYIFSTPSVTSILASEDTINYLNK